VHGAVRVGDVHPGVPVHRELYGRTRDGGRLPAGIPRPAHRGRQPAELVPRPAGRALPGCSLRPPSAEARRRGAELRPARCGRPDDAAVRVHAGHQAGAVVGCGPRGGRVGRHGQRQHPEFLRSRPHETLRIEDPAEPLRRMWQAIGATGDFAAMLKALRERHH